MSCKVSVIIPFYNGIEFLQECVASVQNQTLREIEILLVDDGSTDGSGALADTLALKDERIRVLHQQNAGVSAARNAALDAARGEYIGFVDADDLAEPEMYETMYRIAMEKQCDIVSCAHISFNGNGMCYTNTPPSSPGVVLMHDDVLQRLPTMSTSGAFIYVWRRMFSRALVQKNGVRFDTEITIGEDTLFCLECFLHAERMTTVDRAFYRYRHQPNSAMRKKVYKPTLMRSLARQYDRKRELCAQYNPEGLPVFLRDCAKRNISETFPLVLSNVFWKPDGCYREYRMLMRLPWARDTLRYADIPRSRSLDQVAMRCMQKKLYTLGYCIAKYAYGKDTKHG